MLTDPIRDVDTDSTKKVILCTVAATAKEHVGWSVYWMEVSTIVIEGHRLKVSSPTGKRYAY